MPRDGVIADLIELGGAGLAATRLGEAMEPAGAGVIRVGLDCEGRHPADGLEPYDILLSADPAAPAPFAGVTDIDAALARLRASVEAQPVAAAVAAQVVRTSLAVGFEAALVQESLAYSMLLASEGFQAWRAGNPPRARLEATEPRVLISEAGGALVITLNRAARRNAVDARMRDALCDALAFAAEHPDAPPVVLQGDGPDFSAGGDLDEFGRADDPGRAHLIRTLRSAAAGVQVLGPRLTARLHGACMGAGIEVPAAAARVEAREGARFRLPEVSMGLIPGAGGTATIPRRIGRHRAAWMAISGETVDLPTALAWGLVDAVIA